MPDLFKVKRTIRRSQDLQWVRASGDLSLAVVNSLYSSEIAPLYYGYIKNL